MIRLICCLLSLATASDVKDEKDINRYIENRISKGRTANLDNFNPEGVLLDPLRLQSIIESAPDDVSRISIAGAVFDQPVEFSFYNFLVRVELINCKFNGNVSFTNCHFGNGLSLRGAEMQGRRLEIRNCMTAGNLDLGKMTLASYLLITNVQVEGNILLNNLKAHGFVASDVQVADDLSLRASDVGGEIDLRSISVGRDLDISDLRAAADFSLRDSDCRRTLHGADFNIEGSLGIQNSTVSQLVFKEGAVSEVSLIQGLTGAGTLEVSGTSFGEGLFIFASTARDILLSGNRIQGIALIGDTKFGMALAESVFVNASIIDTEFDGEGLLSLRSLRVDGDLRLENLRSLAFLEVEDIKIQETGIVANNAIDAAKFRLVNAERFLVTDMQSGAFEIGFLQVDDSLFLESLKLNNLEIAQASVGKSTFIHDVNSQELLLANFDAGELTLSNLTFETGEIDSFNPRRLHSGSAEALLQAYETATLRKGNYLQLEDYYTEIGEAETAKKIYLTYRDRVRDQESSALRRMGLSIAKLFDYGRTPWKMGFVLLLFWAVGLAFFWPRYKFERRSTDDSAERFSTFWYSLDLLIPFVNLHLVSDWRIRKQFYIVIFYSRLQRCVGYLLVPIFLLSLVGFFAD